MRPTIPEELEARIDSVYEAGGYSTSSELVRDAVRQRVAVIEGGGENPPMIALAEETSAGRDPDGDGGRPAPIRRPRADPSTPSFEDRKLNSRDAADGGDLGITYGINPFNGTQVSMNRFEGPNPNQIILGDTESGKTVSARVQLARELKANENLRVVYVNPMDRAPPFAEKFGSQRVVLGVDGINPLEIPLGPRSESGGDAGQSTAAAADPAGNHSEILGEARLPVREKRDIAAELLELLVTRGTDREWSEKHEAVLFRAVEEIARDDRTEPETAVTLSDVRAELIRMVENPEAHVWFEGENAAENLAEIANMLCIHTMQFEEGRQLAGFGRPTEFNIADARVTWIDFGEWRSDAAPGFALLAIIEAAFAQARPVDDSVIVAVDEGHLLLRERVAVERLERMFRHGRHNGVGFQFVTHTAEEILRDEDVTPLFRTSSILQLHRMESLSKENAVRLGLNGREAEYVRRAKPGGVAGRDGNGDGAESLVGVGGEVWIPTTVTLNGDERELLVDG